MLNTIQEAVRKMNSEEDDNEDVTPSRELRTKVLKKTLIVQIEHSHEGQPEFFTFTLKYHNFICETYHLQEIEESKVSWVCCLCSNYV